MATLLYVLLAATMTTALRSFCNRDKMPLEIGTWTAGLVHMDSATIENPPVTVREGQVYVYENYFPGQIIQYIHVDNLAKKSCGASISVKAGGTNSPGVLIVLESGPYEEIRTVIDIWGRNMTDKMVPSYHMSSFDLARLHRLKSIYLNQMRAFNHNPYNTTYLRVLQPKGYNY